MQQRNDLPLATIIKHKENDLTMQWWMLSATVVLLPFTMLFSLFLLCLTHAISTIYWLVNMQPVYKMRGRKILERINITVLTYYLLSAFITLLTGSGFLAYATMVLFFSGPVLGASYFIVTIKEIRYYKKILQEEKNGVTT